MSGPLSGIIHGRNETTKVLSNGFIRYNHLTGKRITVHIEGGKIHVREEQNIERMIELNKIQQNEFKRYGNNEMTQITRIPQVIYNDIMRRCGFVPGQGYDHKKFRQILNDPDNRYLKTVSGRI